jgi:hypothetical protein
MSTIRSYKKMIYLTKQDIGFPEKDSLDTTTETKTVLLYKKAKWQPFPNKKKVINFDTGEVLTFSQYKERVKSLINECKKTIQYYNTVESELMAIYPFELTEQEQVWIDDSRQSAKDRIEYLTRKCSTLTSSQVQTENGKLDKEAAKQVPITDYIDFNRLGFAKCIWHNEKTGSLKYYPKDNHVHCHGCHKTGDTIDVVMELYKVSFKEALRMILKK